MSRASKKQVSSSRRPKAVKRRDSKKPARSRVSASARPAKEPAAVLEHPSDVELKERIAQLERQVMVAERLRFESLRTREPSATPAFDASTFVAGVAHEFNNILGAADGHAEWALSSGRPKDMREALEIIRVACRRSAQITRGLQGLFQPREEKKLVFALRSSFNEAMRLLSVRCEKEDVVLDIQIPDVQIYGDPSRVLEVILNLLKNALDAFVTHGELRPAAPRIQIHGRVQKGKRSSIVIRFHDNGPGIPEVFRDLIFQPFFTTKGTLSGALGTEAERPEVAPSGEAIGSGLGLYLSRQIIEEHGGSLECLPSRNGALFELRLPLAV